MKTGGDIVSDDWLTTDRAAALADYTPAHVRQLAFDGRVRAEKVGRDWLVHKGDLLAYKAQVRPGRPRKVAAGD